MAREYQANVRQLSARRVLDYFDKHPHLTSGQIGRVLLKHPAYVRVALSRNGRRLARSPSAIRQNIV